MKFRMIGQLCGLVAVCMLVAGCQTGTLDVPDGWVAEETKWWQEGTDTDLAFRDLTTFSSMGVETPEIVFNAGPETERQQVLSAVQMKMISMYRNNPEQIDSLFQKIAVPAISKNPRANLIFDKRVTRQLQQAYRSVRRHYREPRQRVVIGREIELTVPAGTPGGDVSVQAYLNEAGEPAAIQILTDNDPVLAKVMLHGTSQMRWDPAFLGDVAIPSWVRFEYSVPDAK